MGTKLINPCGNAVLRFLPFSLCQLDVFIYSLFSFVHFALQFLRSRFTACMHQRE